MYSPVRDGIDKAVRSVRYTEAKPPAELSTLVHCFWELKTTTALSEDFHLHALPDACVNILFDQRDAQIAAITALRTRFEVLNLGKTFHYVGVQLMPGAWQADDEYIADHLVDSAYQGALPLTETNRRLAALDFPAKQRVMAELVQRLTQTGAIAHNPVTSAILHNLDEVHTVADMAALTALSARQLQRTLKRTTGFAPHDFLKVVRLQRSFTQSYLTTYADQSHYIHSFRKITGYTPARFAEKYDV
jgi:AraC-like DNA-binding protein